MRQLLIVPMFSWALFSLSCQKKENGSPDSPPINAVDASVHNPVPLPVQIPEGQPLSSPPDEPLPSTPDRPLPSTPDQPLPSTPGQPIPTTPVDPEAPAPVEPAPIEVITSLSIQSEGAFLIGYTKKVHAIAQYASGTQRDVSAQWTLVTNEADATLDTAGYLRAKKIGKVVVRAEFADQMAEAEFQVEVPMLRHKEEQFWVYRLNRESLSFNSPWDKEAGHAIVRIPTNMPDFAKDCLEQAKHNFSVLQNDPGLKEHFAALVGGGATAQLIFMVNVVPVDGRRNDLRRLDRDAYFWHWTREDQRPSLSMSIFQKGSWVWEVIASPRECHQPDTKEIQRYLDYVAMRLVHVP